MSLPAEVCRGSTGLNFLENHLVDSSSLVKLIFEMANSLWEDFRD